jgi:folate-binding protein YgfZ
MLHNGRGRFKIQGALHRAAGLLWVPMRAIVDASSRGRILVSGPDGPAFLHRLSTQHVSERKPGDACLNVLTNDKGRIVDVVHHVVLDADTILLVGHRKTADELIAWLDRYCFSEKVTFAPHDGACILADAASANDVVAGTATLAPWASLQQGEIIAVRTFDRVDSDGALVPTVLLLAPTAAQLPGPPLVALDAVRAMAAGVPGVEMGDAHTPLDLELHDAIHWAKGCYIGQEVIARLDTYGKQRRRLVSVVGDDVAVGDSVVVGVDGADVVVGSVTSTLPSTATPLTPSLPRAMALVKLGADALPTTATLQRADGSSRPATLQVRRTAQLPHE